MKMYEHKGRIFVVSKITSFWLHKTACGPDNGGGYDYEVCLNLGDGYPYTLEFEDEEEQLLVYKTLKNCISECNKEW